MILHISSQFEYFFNFVDVFFPNINIESTNLNIALIIES